MIVSTHSRLKAAGRDVLRHQYGDRGFNTQPPEGGWIVFILHDSISYCFNTQPPEGGWKQRKKAKRSSRLFQHTAA